MVDTFSTALSAFGANATAIKVTGDNLANLNTTGYKASRASFHDLIGQVVSEGVEIGSGVVPLTERIFTQGSFQTTGASLDAAIQGNGFFVVNDTSGSPLYTRAGNFRADANGFLTTATGERVQGWQAVNGTLSTAGATGDIQIPIGGLMAPVPTSQLSVRANLDETTAIGGTFSVPFSTVDSLGETHNLTITFTRATATDWDYDITIPGEDLAAGTAGTPSSLATGTLTFGPDGLLDPTTVSPVALSITGLTNGATDITADWNLFGPGSASLLTHFARPSAVSSISQNGTGAAEFLGVSISNEGQVVARFTQGVELAVGQLALAGIANPDTLVSAGNNNFRTTSLTASPAIGVAGAGGRGLIRGGVLETSTVDIAQEFTNLIRYQRAYQANSRMITTQDEILQETLNLTR